jgi:hypothetical protein
VGSAKGGILTPPASPHTLRSTIFLKVFFLRVQKHQEPLLKSITLSFVIVEKLLDQNNK